MLYTIYLGKLQYFTNLNLAAMWGCFHLLTIIISGEVIVRLLSNLPRYVPSGKLT